MPFAPIPIVEPVVIKPRDAKPLPVTAPRPIIPRTGNCCANRIFLDVVLHQIVVRHALAKLALSSVVRALIACNVLTVVVVICILPIALVTIAVQALASDNGTHLIVVNATRVVRRLLVGVAKHFGHDAAFGLLFADTKLLRDDLRIFLRQRVLVGMQLPVVKVNMVLSALLSIPEITHHRKNAEDRSH